MLNSKTVFFFFSTKLLETSTWLQGMFKFWPRDFSFHFPICVLDRKQGLHTFRLVLPMNISYRLFILRAMFLLDFIIRTIMQLGVVMRLSGTFLVNQWKKSSRWNCIKYCLGLCDYCLVRKEGIVHFFYTQSVYCDIYMLINFYVSICPEQISETPFFSLFERYDIFD